MRVNEFTGWREKVKKGWTILMALSPPPAPVWSLCRGWCQIRHQPPLMTFLRLLRITGVGAWSRREGDRERAQPREEPDNPKPESRSHQLFLLHSPGMRTRDIMCGYVFNLHNNVPFQQFWFWPFLLILKYFVANERFSVFIQLLLYTSSPQQFLAPNICKSFKHYWIEEFI